MLGKVSAMWRLKFKKTRGHSSECDVNYTRLAQIKKENDLISELSKIIMKLSIVQGSEADLEQIENLKKLLYQALKTRLESDDIQPIS